MCKQQSTFAGRFGATILAAAAIASTALVLTTPAAMAQTRAMPMEPLHQSGRSVQPSFEGWWQNADGTYSIMMGYFNRNTQEEVDIPIGPDNHIDPGGPDQGQPTHFLTRRHWGMFTVTVPKDFGDKKLIWTLITNGEKTSVPMSIDVRWNMNPFHEIGIGNTPPTISFDESGPSGQGQKPIVVERTAQVGVPLSLTVWAADDAKSLFPGGGARGAGRGRGGRGGPAAAGDGAAAGRGGPGRGAPAADPNAALIAAATAAGVDADTIAQFLPRGPVTITWSKFRGSGEVKFAANKPHMEAIPDGTIPKKDVFNGKATTTATFSEPGEYILLAVANDSSGEGGGGFLCCWTNGEVKVSVK